MIPLTLLNTRRVQEELDRLLQHPDTKAKVRACARTCDMCSMPMRCLQPVLFFANKMDISGHLQPVECVQVTLALSRACALFYV